jgi:hypothetical protein
MTPKFGLLLALLASLLGFASLSTSGTDAHSEVLRFAQEGRANLGCINLASGRSAKVTVATMSALASSRLKIGNRHNARASLLNANGTDFLQVIEVPASQRGTIKLRFDTDDPAIIQSVTEAAEFLSRVVAARWLPTSEIHVKTLWWFESRAYATEAWGRSAIYLPRGFHDTGTAVHELAHHIEMDHSAVLEASRRFLKRRGHGEPAQRLSDLSGDGYAWHEVAIEANWARRGGMHYSGKFYGPSVERATATELISTGLERLHSEPAAFFKSDADYFLFLLLALQAEIPMK